MASNAPLHATGTPELHTGEVRKLSTLLEASQALLREPLLRSALEGVLEILHRHHGAIRSTVVLLNATSGEVELDPYQVMSTMPGLPATTQGITVDCVFTPLSTWTAGSQVAPWSVELVRKT